MHPGLDHLFLAFGIDLVAISVLTYGLYFRRHQRRDLTLGLVGVNIGLFAVAAFTATHSFSVGFGIGLFALLSVIRLRSTVASLEEIGYYFVALVIGIVNGLAADDSWGTAVALNVMLLGVIFVADHPRMLPHAGRQILVLNRTRRSPERLKEDVEDRLGFEVVRLRVLSVDYARGRTRIDARFRTDRPIPKRPKAPKPVPATVEAPPPVTPAVNGMPRPAEVLPVPASDERDGWHP
jgi:hypothetical protein